MALLRARRHDVLMPLVARRGGRVFKVMGDGVLIEFTSVVNAVECAIELQKAMQARNADLPAQQHILLRIGINLGDVMVEVVVDLTDWSRAGYGGYIRGRARRRDGRVCLEERSAMPGEDSARASASSNFYGPQYARIDSELAAEIRREVFGEDIGQESWRTAAEQAEITDLLGLTSESRVLDVACGAGGPSLALVERTGCRLTGLDIEPEGIAHANSLAARRDLADRASFAVVDCSGRLPFEDRAFYAVLSIDAISHLPDRFGALSEWGRLLRKSGRLVFTDPLVLTGAVTKSEIDGRSALGSNLSIVPPGLNEEAIGAAGLTMLRRQNRASAVAEIATRWHAARLRRAAILKREEGEEWFERRQRMLATSAELAGSGRLSRFLYVAEKPY